LVAEPTGRTGSVLDRPRWSRPVRTGRTVGGDVEKSPGDGYPCSSGGTQVRRRRAVRRRQVPRGSHGAPAGRRVRHVGPYRR